MNESCLPSVDEQIEVLLDLHERLLAEVARRGAVRRRLLRLQPRGHAREALGDGGGVL